MALNSSVKTTFEPAKVIQPIYTRGSVALSEDDRILASCLDDDVLLTDARTGDELARIEGDGEICTTLAITPSASHLIICSRSLAMRIYALTLSDEEDVIETQVLRTLKPHPSPVVVSAVDQTGTLLATGGADGVVKVWDIIGGYVTHTFHGHNGVISALRFFQVDVTAQAQEESKKCKKKRKQGEEEEVTNEETLGYRLASGGEDGKVRIWNLHKRNSAAILDSHVSVVRTLDFSPEENALLSGSRDKTVMVWDARTWKIRSTIPVLEEVESAGFLDRGTLIYTGGEHGRIRIWSLASARELTPEQQPGMDTESILEIIHYPDLPYLLSVHADQTLVYHSIASLSPSVLSTSPLPILRRTAGTHGQIIDVAYIGRSASLLALATNAEDIRLISLQPPTPSESLPFGAEVASLKGHTDIVLCLATDWSGHWLATGAKDNTARLWRLDPASNSFTCHATFAGHAESVGAVALPQTPPPADTPAYKNPAEHTPAWLITGSQDKTLKRWPIPRTDPAGPVPVPRATYTRKAHDKDINALAVAPTGQLLASSSQDRLVKIWAVEDGSTVGVLRGHKRGVWSASFAPTGITISLPGTEARAQRGFVATAGADRMVKLWALSDFSCLLTLEGHTGSVLKALWLPPTETRGPAVVSAAADGLVKIWDVSSGECAATLDGHTDRVWALARRPVPGGVGETLVSGAGDGVLTFWADTSAATAAKAAEHAAERVEKGQQLENYVRAQQWREAIALALALDHPGRLLGLFKSVVEGQREEGSWTGRKDVDDVLRGLASEQVARLVRRCREWGTSARTAVVAHRVLRALVEGFGVEGLAGTKVGKGGEVWEGLRVYGERHWGRVADLWDESFLVEFTLGEMEGVLGVEAGEKMVLG
ncbi:WD40 repeat-like protein [Trichodelitschia bisporula]|uniref:WD40 repeat-like protein n=1 Tax=Trichodelitschia bisporula TaxID=703511 RepID=A0A6G1IAL0_9PEZI|nr:WD40 repeat-like protein [Trichodelitschia bisporula]